MRSLRLLPVTLAVLLAACGDSLVDHSNIGVRDAQQPATCDPGTASCTTDAVLACVPDSVTQCGATCSSCLATVTPPSGAEAACLAPLDHATQSSCGWQCTAGFLRCTDACCGTTAVAAGAAHTCAIAAGGIVYCWGADSDGQVTAAAPTAGRRVVAEPAQRYAGGATAIAAGNSHTCAVVSGQVECWGRNAEGQAPAAVPEAAGAIALTAGVAHTCAIVPGGSVKCWGSTVLGQTGGGTPALPSAAIAISAGADHTCALLDTGAVLCWGGNGSRELGNPGTTAAFSATPVLAIPSAMTALGAGAHHTCATTGNKNVAPSFVCWGANFIAGDLASVLPSLGSPQATPAEPQKLSGGVLLNFDIASIGAGRLHTCVQRAGQGFSCFGADDADGQLGTAQVPGEKVDVAGIPLGTPVMAIGGDHGCAVFANGSLHCWGRNTSGQLGDGTTATPAVGTLVDVKGR